MRTSGFHNPLAHTHFNMFVDEWTSANDTHFNMFVDEWTSANESPVRPFYGTADTLFCNSSDVSSGFQSQNGQNYLRSIETYMLHVSILVHIIIIAFFLKMKKCITILTNSTE